MSDAHIGIGRLRYKLAALLIQHHGFPTGLVSLIVKRLTEQAAFEKHSSAVEELAGFMQEVARAALLLYVNEDDMLDQQDALSTLLIRPLLRSAAKTPAKQMASNAYVLVNAALMVFFEQAQSPSVAAVAMDCLKHILGSMSTGQSRVLVAEAFLPMRKSVEILGADMKPTLVLSLISESVKCMQHKSDWQLRKQAADTIAALAASSQVFRKTEDAWQLERSDSLAILAAEKSAILAALTDVKYDKIVHVRQVYAPERPHPQSGMQEEEGMQAPQGPWEATPEARAVLHGQRELMAQLQRLLVNPGALQAPGASLKELQGSLLQATASLQHSRALHNIQGVLGDSYRFDTPPAAQRQTRSDGQSSFGGFPVPGLLEETPNQAAVMGDYGVQQQDEHSLEDFQQDIQEDEDEPLAGITREVNRLLRSPGKPASRRWSLEHPTQAKMQKTPVDANGDSTKLHSGAADAAEALHPLPAMPKESGGKVAQLEALRFQVNRELDALLKLVES
ncbi:hypothetical protein WJX75_009136 [Coccomyxa subellipsoidea]|uniref:TOG domain-containing protein n=1 Tax=Coccomyxa subellipsoidea TaxID=248742 RepID=A0ABR2YK49_9CHLO